MAEQLRQWGATEAQIDEKLGEVEEPVLELLVENFNALKLYLACQTQWRISAMGQRIGLDYPGVDQVIKHRGFTASPDLFERLQIVESAALRIFKETSDA